MGQFNAENGGHIYLVEDVKDVENLVIEHPEKLFYVTQTTLSMDDAAAVIDALRKKFPQIQGPRKDDICYATQNRQDAVKNSPPIANCLLWLAHPTAQFQSLARNWRAHGRKSLSA